MTSLDQSQLEEFEERISKRLESPTNLDELESYYSELEQILYQRFMFACGN